LNAELKFYGSFLETTLGSRDSYGEDKFLLGGDMRPPLTAEIRVCDGPHLLGRGGEGRADNQQLSILPISAHSAVRVGRITKVTNTTWFNLRKNSNNNFSHSFTHSIPFPFIKSRTYSTEAQIMPKVARVWAQCSSLSQMPLGRRHPEELGLRERQSMWK